jgi:osmotically-inducible protein OsmY
MPLEKHQTLKHVMKNQSEYTGQTLRVSALTLCVGAVLLFGVTGCVTNRGPTQTAGEQVDDDNATSLVNTALAADTEYKFDGVKVETSSGTVQLSGFVSSLDQKTRAGDIATKVTSAMKVSSVKAVVNNITVNTPAS